MADQPPIFPTSPFLTIQELAQELRVPTSTIYYWVHRKEIPHLKIGRHLRFQRNEVISFFERKTGPQTACKPMSELLKPKPWFEEKSLRASSVKTEEEALLKLKKE